jgi:L-glyceraldehyde reductase
LFSILRLAKPGEVEESTYTALQSGYKHIDAAAIYMNEREVGNGIKRANLPREDIWVTSKLWNNSHQPAEGPYLPPSFTFRFSQPC